MNNRRWKIIIKIKLTLQRIESVVKKKLETKHRMQMKKTKNKHNIVKNFFLSFFKNYFSWRLITLQCCSGFCHTSIWISHGFTCVHHPEHPSHLPPHPILLAHPSAPALSTLSHVLNLDWQSVSCMIVYIFKCYLLRSSHLRLLHRVQKTVLYIYVSFPVLHTGLSLIIFHNSIYMC